MGNASKYGPFSPVPHTYLERLARINVPGAEGRVLHLLLRDTFGHHRLFSTMSNGKLARITGLSKQHVIRALKGLEARNLIQRIRGRNVLVPIPAPVEAQVPIPGTGGVPDSALLTPDSVPDSAHSLKNTTKIPKKEGAADGSDSLLIEGDELRTAEQQRRLESVRVEFDLPDTPFVRQRLREHARLEAEQRKAKG